MRQRILFWISICWITLQSPVWAQQSPVLDSLLKVYREDHSHATAQQLNNIGCAYYGKYTYEGYRQALQWHLRALDKAKAEKNAFETARSYRLIAAVYDATNMNLDQAEEYYERYLMYHLTTHDTLNIIDAYRNVIVINYKLKRKVREAFFADKLFSYIRNSKAPQLARFKNQLSVFYAENGELDKAEILFTPIDVDQAARDDIESFRNYYFAGHALYREQRKSAKAIEFLNGLLPKVTLAVDSISIMKHLSEHYRDLGDFQHAFIFLDKSTDLHAHYLQDVDRNKIGETVAFYRNEQTEKETAYFKEKSESETRIINYIFLLLVLLLIAIVVVFLISIRTSNQNRLLKVQKEEVERLNRLNQKIFSVISHDFNGPLISLNLLLDVLKNKDLRKEELDEFTEDIGNQLVQSKMILENLLSWAKVELNLVHRKHETSLVSNPQQITQNVIRHLHSSIIEKNMHVHNEIPENVLLKILPDIFQIVVRNLLSNAIKFSHSNGDIYLRYDAEKNLLQVIDHGVGMDQKRIDMLFKQAVGNKLGTSNETGFGLGLYMSQELVNKSNGKISVQSEIGKGTIFTLDIPLYENA
jgi:signal transduction histidine kinase